MSFAFESDMVMRRLLKVPKRLRASTMLQRSPAQYGQYSAPTYRNSGLPSGPVSLVGVPVTAWRGFDTPPDPTVVETWEVTPVTALSTAAGAVGRGAMEPLVVDGVDDWATTMKITITATTAAARPPAPGRPAQRGRGGRPGGGGRGGGGGPEAPPAGVDPPAASSWRRR